MSYVQAMAVFNALTGKWLDADELGEVVRRSLQIADFDNAAVGAAIELLRSAGVVRARFVDGRVEYCRGEPPEKLSPTERLRRQEDASARARVEQQKHQSGWTAIERPDGSVFMVPKASDGLNQPVVDEYTRFIKRIVVETLRELGIAPQESEAAETASI